MCLRNLDAPYFKRAGTAHILLPEVVIEDGVVAVDNILKPMLDEI